MNRNGGVLIGIIGGITGVVLTKAVTNRVQKILKKKSLEDLATQRRKEKLIEEEKAREIVNEFYSKNTVDEALKATILSAHVSELAIKIATGIWKSSTVLIVYVENALIKNEKANFATAWVVEKAFERAIELDNILATTGKVVGPLHGVPISVKENLGCEGTPQTMGVYKFCGSKATQHSLVIKSLVDSGANPFCTTNVPQTLMSFECRNPVYGVTPNPFNPAYTCGGSSGGEGCGIALDCSPLGVGTDIGGSVRIPAHFCGIAGLKPSAGRIPLKGVTTAMPGQEALPGVVGLMGRSNDDLLLSFKAILSQRPWENDGYTHNLPFREEIYRSITHKKLVIGYYLDDGWMPTSPPCRRAVQMAVDALKAQGHTVVPFVPPRMDLAIELLYSLVSSGGITHFSKMLENEPIEDFVQISLTYGKMHPLLKKTLAYIALKTGNEIESRHLMLVKARSALELYGITAQRNAYRDQFSKLWNSSGPNGTQIDALVCPVHPLPAIPHGTSKNIGFSTNYTSLYNILDYSVCSIKVTSVDRSIDIPQSNFLESDTPQKRLIQRVARLYDANAMHGLPVGVQVVAPRLQEEVALGATKVLEDSLKSIRELRTPLLDIVHSGRE